MKIFLLIVAFILILTVIPIKCHFFFINNNNKISVSVLGIKVFDNQKQKKKPKKEKTKKKKKLKPKDKSKKSESSKEKTDKKEKSSTKKKKSKDNVEDNTKKKGKFKEVIEFYKEETDLVNYSIVKALKAVIKILRTTSIKKLYIDIKCGDEEAYDAAMGYAKYNEFIWCALGFLASFMPVYKKKINLSVDYLEEKTKYKIGFNIEIRLCNILAVVFVLAFTALKLFIWFKTGKGPVDKRKVNHNEKEFTMSENNKVSNIMGVTMDKIKEMVDVNTIIGEPIKVDGNVTIIPVSKVTYGFGSGGSDLPVKNTTKDLFGGGAGAGVSIRPIGFIAVQNGKVNFTRIPDEYKGANSVIDLIPGLFGTVTDLFAKNKDGKEKKIRKSKKKADVEIAEEVLDEEK